ncbi:MAG: superfamily, partial [Cytophagaceae bacterium]|nr:superfamily [Cytophagaceae bacterium]
AYSRMALGVHYPLDVFAGIVMGVGVSCGTIYTYNRVAKTNHSKFFD